LKVGRIIRILGEKDTALDKLSDEIKQAGSTPIIG